VGGAVRNQLQVLYSDFKNGVTSAVHIRTGSIADITLRMSQLEINTTIDAKAFEVEIPRDALAMTIEELRRSGPLGEK
jgi:outer membrane lipoprotein-sorting protein